MCKRRAMLAIGAALVAALAQDGRAAERAAPYGIDALPPWTSSRVVGTPDPPPPFVAVAAFGQLKFREPVALVAAPWGDAWLLVERRGRVHAFAHDEAAATTQVVFDLQPEVAEHSSGWDLPRDMYSLAFDPDFATNRFCYVCYNQRQPPPARNHIVRYRLAAVDPPRIDPASGLAIVEWETNGHNGGCLAFGSDRLLYASSGDGTTSADEGRTGQDPSDLAGGILRLDVRGASAERPYRIPPDNPWIDTPGVRPELWCYGLRNPWKIAFDRTSGQLWCGDNGQDLWESAFLIERGANYGWPVFEGGHPHFPGRELEGPQRKLTRPAVVHPHTEGRSLIGGHVYRGDRLPELVGAYIYGDYATGKIWAVRHDGRRIQWHKLLAETRRAVIAFGQDGAGEVYPVTFDGAIWRLEPAPEPQQPPAPFPHKLSETGLFASVARHEPAAGLVPYDVNAPLWSDGAAKVRYLALPPGGQMAFDPRESWDFPDGTVLVKTFMLTVAEDDGPRERRLETRLLHREQGEWHFYTYSWNDDETDARLAPAEGLDRDYTVADDAVPGGRRTQRWHFPSRTECGMCHSRQSKFVLGLATRQLNRSFDYQASGGRRDNQLRTLLHLGLVGPPKTPQALDVDLSNPEIATELPRFVDPADEAAALAERARTYLHVNCAHCHQRDGGGGRADFQLPYWLDLDQTGTFDRPAELAGGRGAARLIAPGEPDRSAIVLRMASLDPSLRMPRAGSLVVDRAAVQLVRRWIASLAPVAPQEPARGR